MRGMSESDGSEALVKVERLFPFVIRAKLLLVGRQTLARSKSNLQFILITDDLTENSRDEIAGEFKHYPIVQCFKSADMDRCFALRNTKVVGFRKSDLSKSVYAELKSFRINKPPIAPGGDGATGNKKGDLAAAFLFVVWSVFHFVDQLLRLPMN